MAGSLGSPDLGVGRSVAVKGKLTDSDTVSMLSRVLFRKINCIEYAFGQLLLDKL